CARYYYGRYFDVW
nr:immunoglobulin heavy chain junction region [Mus musculus]